MGALCCASLLEQAGIEPCFAAAERAKVPAVMIGEGTQKLLRDVFGVEDLFAGLPRVNRRVVAWGPEARPVAVPHAGVVVAEQELLERLRRRAPRCAGAGEAADWTVLGARPLHAGSVERAFGSRTASARRVKLRGEEDACWVESLGRGWLFLLAAGAGSGWLLAVGGDAERLLGESRLVAEQVGGMQEGAGTFACHPRIADPLSGPGWVACGSAAMGLDPLCGDGTGYAAREGILASAIVRAATEGKNAGALAAHYAARLTGGFQKHLEACLQFYRTGGQGDWWQEEAAALRRGLEWCRERLDGAPPFRFRLNGFSLEEVS